MYARTGPPDTPSGPGRGESRSGRGLDGMEPAVSNTLPPPDPTHSIAEVLALVDTIRKVAFDRTLTNDDIARGVRDLIRAHDGEDFGDDQ
jgi:hypothetical protein